MQTVGVCLNMARGFLLAKLGINIYLHSCLEISPGVVRCFPLDLSRNKSVECQINSVLSTRLINPNLIPSLKFDVRNNQIFLNFAFEFEFEYVFEQNFPIIGINPFNLFLEAF